MSTLQNKLIFILNNCCNNKTIEEFNYIKSVVSRIECYEGSYKTIRNNDSIEIYISDISISFFNNETIVLQKGLLKSYSIISLDNCGYNLQYDKITQLLDK